MCTLFLLASPRSMRQMTTVIPRKAEKTICYAMCNSFAICEMFD